MNSKNNENSQNTDKLLRSPLLEDQELTDLVVDSYKRDETPIDQLSAKRSWSAIQEKLNTQKTDSRFKLEQWPRRQMYVLAAAFLLGFAGYLAPGLQDERMQIKGNDWGVTVDLSATLTNSTAENTTDNRTYYFQQRPSQTSYSQLLREHENGDWLSVSDIQQVDGGVTATITKDSEIYGYALDQSEIVRFCVLAAESEVKLLNNIKKLHAKGSEIAGRRCVSIGKRE